MAFYAARIAAGPDGPGAPPPHAVRMHALAMGVCLLVWLAVETLMIGWHGGPQLPLDLVCGGLGAALIGLALPSTSLS